MNAVIDARYSSSSQREETVEVQIRECTKFAKENGYTILRCYTKSTPIGVLSLVPLTGIEPVRILLRGILSPLCLPVPPQRHGVILTHLLPSVKKNRLDKLWFPL